MALEPPVTLPRGTSIGGAKSVEVAVNCQLCSSVGSQSGWPLGVRDKGAAGAAANPYFRWSGKRSKSG